MLHSLMPKIVAGRDAPIHQRSFFEVADAIHVQCDPVVALQHFACRFGVDGIGIVQQRRMATVRPCK